MALLEASRDEELENAMTELAVSQSHAAASQSAADRATAHVEGLDANRENIGTGNYDYDQWSADVAAANTEVSQIATAEAAARTARTTAGNATIAAAKSENAAIRAAAEQAAEVQHKNDTTWEEVEYLATIFDLEASYVYALMENLDTGLEAALDKYMASIAQADANYHDEACRLSGRYQDAMNLIPSGGTVDANFYENGATSVNVQVCFIAGFEIELCDGTIKKIEDFEGGEEFQTRFDHDPLGPLQKCRVVRAFKNEPKETIRITFDNGLELQATEEHPFYVLDKGWVPCENLTVGDQCTDRDLNPIAVTKLEFVTEKLPVYNIEVEGCHTYYIGKDGKNVLVHNECGICNGTGVIIGGGLGVISFPHVPGAGVSYDYDIPCVCQSYAKVLGKGDQVNIKFVKDSFGDSVHAFRGSTTFMSKNAVVGSTSKWIDQIDVDMNRSIAGVGQGFHRFTSFEPGDDTVDGAGGMDPCVGTTIYSKKGKMIAVFHFGGACNEVSTLKKYQFPSDSCAIVAGGNMKGLSRLQLYNLITTLKSKGVKVIGVSPSSGIFCDSSGRFFLPGNHRYDVYTWEVHMSQDTWYSGPPKIYTPKEDYPQQ